MGINFEGLANNDNTYGENRRSTRFWRPQPGENIVRILPPTLRYFKEDINFFTYVYTNHFVRIDKGQFEVFRCLRDNPETPKCPACTFFFKYRNSEDEAVQKMASQFSSSPRHIMNVVVVEQENGDVPEGIQVYECGPGVYEDIKLYAANKRYGDIFHPEKGRNMIIHLTPASEHKTRRNQYNVAPDDGNSSVVHLLGDDWKEKIQALEGNIPDFQTEDYVQTVVDTAAELVGISASPRGTVSAGSTVAPPKASEEDDSFDVDLDEDSSDTNGDIDLDDFDGLLDDDDIDF